jgi:hypothetical protein
MRWRRLAVSQHLRREGLGCGVKARLARTLGVSKATITSDVRATLAMSVGDFSAGGIKACTGRQTLAVGSSRLAPRRTR